MSAGHAGLSIAKELPGIDQEDWQDASARVTDSPLQAAVADGVVSFVHATNGMQDKEKPGAFPGMKKSTSGNQQQSSTADSKENLSPEPAKQNASIDDVSCLELE